MLEDSAAGALLRVRVVPGAGRNQVAGRAAGRLRLRIQAPPVEGKANRELIRYVAALTGLRKSRVSIVQGEGHREKTLLLAGMPAAEARLKLETFLPEE
ncbi:MAG: DUF167 domain-containing protein [Gaiellales bacterium]|nr:MAG: DUF167 domain-containing protein [Gaiellales bacterium]